jgi:hypothetical protein
MSAALSECRQASCRRRIPAGEARGWTRRNPRFETKLLPTLREAVAAALGETGLAGLGAGAEAAAPRRV